MSETINKIREGLGEAGHFMPLEPREIAERLADMGEAEWTQLADACDTFTPTLSERRELISLFRGEP